MNNQDKRPYTQKPIPQGWEVFTLTFGVAGVLQRQEAIKTALPAKDLQPDIFIEPEPFNEHDKNALKVIVRKKVFFINTKFHIGYVPAKLARIMCKNDLQYVIKLRIRHLIRTQDNTLVVICDFLGESKYMTDKLRKRFQDIEI